ncbi:hypothetical protein [Phaeobacter sp. B1627]|uniref:hypothetical protein n=1 Tax=Phaeobacter sp. B1627 TaxID=2583809 RepID=UPI00111B6211|nr:hypothetical protein [Phaeobacter sp. B1627]TNJ45116.1 hypothetical protein FGE21_06880 [Phaeobacter sp. B1627]
MSSRLLSERIRAAFRCMILGVLGALFLSGCDVFPIPFELEESEDLTTFNVVPNGQAWISTPDTLITLQRNLRDSVDQRIGLKNHTLMGGENYIHIRARTVEGRFMFDEFIERAGGLPTPFTALDAGQMIATEDGLGTYIWTSKAISGNSTCVLAMRRVTQVQRQIPGNHAVMDILLRNCVRGSAEVALEPIKAAHVGYYPLNGRGASDSLMLSPLAGPSPF